MSLKTHVIAGNITNLSDARYCAGMGVEWLSFSSSNVDPTLFKEITQWVAGIQFVIKLENKSSEQILKNYPVNWIEIGPSQLNLIDKLPNYKWIVEIPFSDWLNYNDLLKARKESIEFIILTGLKENLEEIVKEVSKIFNVVLDIKADSVDRVITLPIYGIRVTGGNEIRPGLIDHDKISSILELLEEE